MSTVSRIKILPLATLMLSWLLPGSSFATVITFDESGKMVINEAVDYRYPDAEPPNIENAVMLRAVSPVSEYGPKYETIIRDVAGQFDNLDFHLLNSLIAQESAYDPCAVSPKGAMGLAQLMPDTANRLGVTDRCDPVQSVRAGAYELSRTIDKFGSISLGLAAYNAGDAAVIKYGGIPPYEETQDYVVRVLSRTIAAQEQHQQSNN